MSKDNKVAEKEIKTEVKNNGTVESEDKSKEAINTIRIQLKDHLQKAEYHRTMATKAQGALEVLLQLHPEKDNSEG